MINIANMIEELDYIAKKADFLLKCKNVMVYLA